MSDIAVKVYLLSTMSSSEYRSQAIWKATVTSHAEISAAIVLSSAALVGDLNCPLVCIADTTCSYYAYHIWYLLANMWYRPVIVVATISEFFDVCGNEILLAIMSCGYMLVVSCVHGISANEYARLKIAAPLQTVSASIADIITTTTLVIFLRDKHTGLKRSFTPLPLKAQLQVFQWTKHDDHADFREYSSRRPGSQVISTNADSENVEDPMIWRNGNRGKTHSWIPITRRHRVPICSSIRVREHEGGKHLGEYAAHILHPRSLTYRTLMVRCGYLSRKMVLCCEITNQAQSGNAGQMIQGKDTHICAELLE
ncbi:hypothetical protein POSPLADRAFT_1145790 [Postia placenta MAD-698-R-SB12]|uniref:Uncharacterized protein n=1 Tax=Postia placenta MAD-698-R-SB12 TaxID=670580 RepID=A0A1X6MX52_9APHY|nr:hypothetical protein POSPLADRAFT_1145790 [Postia placenta MAD-698-R-SB12]OSX60793.1 hypothetical protein POSPLADRAFT_1145790 [Postia placenta MAD-698-R-SB12]